MDLISLTKEVKLEQRKVILEFTIELDVNDFAMYDYQGFDLIDDEMIPDILLAISRRYKNKIKKGRILREKVGSII